MSDFAPGFAGRTRVAEQVLHRAFHDIAAFAPTQVDDIGRRNRRATDPQPAPRHFAPADPGARSPEAREPFAAEPQPPREPFCDPIAVAHAAGVAEGRAQALAEAAEARAREAALLDQVSQALAGGAHFDRERMAGHLRQTVLHLVTRMIGEVGISGDVLAARIAAAVDLLADGAESALLRLHPEDVALVHGKLASTVFPVGDPHVARGHFVVESASTLVEDGPDQWLEQLAQAIDRVPLPPAC